MLSQLISLPANPSFGLVIVIQKIIIQKEIFKNKLCENPRYQNRSACQDNQFNVDLQVIIAQWFSTAACLGWGGKGDKFMNFWLQRKLNLFIFEYHHSVGLWTNWNSMIFFYPMVPNQANVGNKPETPGSNRFRSNVDQSTDVVPKIEIESY